MPSGLNPMHKIAKDYLACCNHTALFDLAGEVSTAISITPLACYQIGAGSFRPNLDQTG